MDAYIETEIEFVVKSLEAVGINITKDEVATWNITDRAMAEQWAIRLRWQKMKRPPCPPNHQRNLFPAPKVLDPEDVKAALARFRLVG